MKKNALLFIKFVITLCCFTAVLSLFAAEQSFSQSVIISNIPEPPDNFFHIPLWSIEFWLAVALIVSEVAALLPGKISGIIQGIAQAFVRNFNRK